MQIHSFVAVASGAEASEAAIPLEGQPSRGAREFARHLAGAVGAGDPDVPTTIDDGAVEAAATEGLPFSAVVIDIARGMPETSNEPQPEMLVDSSRSEPVLVGPNMVLGRNGRDARSVEGATLESKPMASQALSQPPSGIQSPAGLIQAAARPQEANQPQAELPEGSTDKIVVSVVSRSPMQLDLPTSQKPSIPQGESAEGRLALPHGPAVAQSMPPEQAKALGLARAPVIVGEDALPEPAVARGIREAPRISTSGGAMPDQGRLSSMAPVQATTIAPDTEAASDSSSESRSEKSQDRPIEKAEAQTANPAKEKPALPTFVAPQPLEALLEDGASIRPAESQISGPSGLLSHPSAPAFSSASSAGLGHAAIQQLAVAIRRSEGGEIEIALEPEELGKVRLTLAPQDTRVTVSVLVERPETLELIRRHIDALTNDLRQQGYSEVALDFAQNQNRKGNKGPADLPPQAAASDEMVPMDVGPILPRRPVRAGGLDLRL